MLPVTTVFFSNFQRTVPATKLQRNICFYDSLNQKYKVQHDVLWQGFATQPFQKAVFVN